jgi:hypothetical protein
MFGCGLMLVQRIECRPSPVPDEATMTYARFEDLPVWKDAIRSIERRGAFADLRSQISNLKSSAVNCSRQFRAWADHLIEYGHQRTARIRMCDLIRHNGVIGKTQKNKC